MADITFPELIDHDEEVEGLLNRPKENDSGHIEYKYKLTNLTDAQRERLTSQLKTRLHNEKEYGQAVYDIGLTDDGFAIGLTEEQLSESLHELHNIVANASAKICDVRREVVEYWARSEEEFLERYLKGNLRSLPDGSSKRKRAEAKKDKERAESPESQGDQIKLLRYVAEVLIRKHDYEGDYVDLKIGVAGNVDCGKTTLIGVMTKGVLDDGDGAARSSVMRLKHEQDTGRTSAIGQQIMGFNDRGQSIVDVTSLRKPTWEDIVKDSTKVITFFDLAGHKKYLKTTIHGIASNRPDYALIMVGANMGLTEMTTEHINLCLTHSIPFVVVMTKIDMAPKPVMEATLDAIKTLLSKKTPKLSYKIKTEDDVMKCARQLRSTDLAPIFFISNVTGEGIPLLKLFLNYLPVRKSYRKARSKPVKLQVQESFHVRGVGTIASGLLLSGSVRLNDNLKMGPTSTGDFIDVRIRSIECKRVSCTSVSAGKYVCLGLPGIDRHQVKKGMFILSPEWHPKAVWEFEAKVHINKSSAPNIRVGYQPYCHIGHIRQSCKILDISHVELGRRTKKLMCEQGLDPDKHIPAAIGAGDRANIRMRFCFTPQMIFEEDKTRFVIREQKTRGIGMITGLSEQLHEPMTNREVTKRLKIRPSRRERREIKRKELEAHGEPFVVKRK